MQLFPALCTLFVLAAVGESASCKGIVKFRAGTNQRATMDHVRQTVKNRYDFVTGITTKITWSNFCDSQGCAALDADYVVTTQGTQDYSGGGCIKDGWQIANSIGITYITPGGL